MTLLIQPALLPRGLALGSPGEVPATRAAPVRPAPPRRGRLARLGPYLPLGFLLLGMALPEVSALAFRALPAALAAGAFFGILALPGWGRPNPAGAVLQALALCLVSPMIGFLLARFLGATPAQCGWVALAAAAPAGMGAIGLAATMGLGASRVAWMVIGSSLAIPVILPGLAMPLVQLSGLSPIEVGLQLGLLALLPLSLALPLRRVPELATERARRFCAIAATVAVSVQALARAGGAGEALMADPGGVLALLGLACLPGVAGIVACLAVMPRRAAAEAVLAGGYRNVTLVWAVAAPVLPAEGHLFMALTALPVYAAPALASLLRR